MKGNKILSIFLAVGLLFGAVFAFQRHNVERDYNNYEIVMDYQELVKLADVAGENTETYIKGMQEAGVSSIAISEETISSLKLDPNYHITTYLSGYDLVVKGEKEILDFIKSGLEETLKEERTIEFQDDETLRIEGSAKDYVSNVTKVKDVVGNDNHTATIYDGSMLEYVGIGYSGKKIEKIQSLGMEVVLRPTYVSDYQDSEKAVDRFFNTIKEYNINQNYIIFSGGEVLGSDNIDYIAEKMKENNMAVVPIEDTTQLKHIKTEGMDSLVEKMDYNAIRGFTTWDYIQRRYDYQIPMHHNGEEIVNTFYRAISERNIRVIYFKPYITPKEKYVTDISEYNRTLNMLKNRLAEHGIVPGTPVAMKMWEPNYFMKIPVILGIIAAGCLVLESLFRIKDKYLYILFGAASLLGIAANVSGVALDMQDKVWGLLSAIVYPTLSICIVSSYAAKVKRDKISKQPIQAFLIGCVVLLVSILISLVGALGEVSMLSHSKYLLEFDAFKGVKLSQLAPMGMAIIIYLAHFGYKREENTDKTGIKIKEIIHILNENVKIYQVVICAVLLVVVYIFIGRSGNDSGLSVSSFELLFRNILEMVFPARPRTKSIFLGFPAVIMLMYLIYTRRYMWLTPLLIISVAIGQSDIANTFSHLRTPLSMSFQRVAWEYVIAIAVAIIMAIAVEIINKIEKKFRSR